MGVLEGPAAGTYLDLAGQSHTAAVKDSMQLTEQAASAQQAGRIIASQIGMENLYAAMEADGTAAQTLRTLEQRLGVAALVDSTVAALPASMAEVTDAGGYPAGGICRDDGDGRSSGHSGNATRRGQDALGCGL